MPPFILVLILVAVFAAPAGAESPSACSLLTSSDVEAVTGGKIGASQPIHFDDVPAGPNRSMKVLGCMWSVPTQTGQIHQLVSGTCHRRRCRQLDQDVQKQRGH